MYRALLQDPDTSTSDPNCYKPGCDTWDSSDYVFTAAPIMFGAVALVLIGLLFCLASCILRKRIIQDIEQNPVHLQPHEYKIEDLCPLPPVTNPPVVIVQPDSQICIGRTSALSSIQEGDAEGEDCGGGSCPHSSDEGNSHSEGSQHDSVTAEALVMQPSSRTAFTATTP